MPALPKRSKKLLGPAVDVVLHKVVKHSAMTILSFVNRHLKSLPDRDGHRLGFVRVNRQCAVQLLG
jgi:hypothetical protein